MMRKFISLMLPLVLVGCASQDMSDLRDFVAEVKARPPSGIEPIPEIKQVVGFVYQAKGRRDPFTHASIGVEPIAAQKRFHGVPYVHLVRE